MIVSKNIYLADDDTDDHFIFEAALEEICEDCTLTIATSGDELLSNLRKPDIPSPDIVFLDINMPRKNGIETLKEIKGDPETKGLKVIMYSTSTNPLYIDQAKEAGACFYFVKPTDFSKLKQLLLKTLSLHWGTNNVPSKKHEFMIS